MYHMPTVINRSSRIIIRLQQFYSHCFRQFTLDVQKNSIRCYQGQGAFEIGICFCAHKNWHPNFDKVT